MSKLSKKDLIKKENDVKQQNTGLANSCKEKPDTYSYNELVQKYENTDMYPEE